MKPIPIAVLVAVIAGLLWWFWPRDKPQAPVTAQAPATAPAAAPAAAPASAPAPAPAPAVAAAPPPPPAAPPPPPKPEPLVVRVLFEFDRSALPPAESPKLDDLAAKLKDRPYARVNVVGHADRIGEAPHNDALSRKRADAVVVYLVAKGVDAKRSYADAKGESESVVAGGCKDLGAEQGTNAKLVECLKDDRRADIVVVD